MRRIPTSRGNTMQNILVQKDVRGRVTGTYVQQNSRATKNCDNTKIWKTFKIAIRFRAIVFSELSLQWEFARELLDLRGFFVCWPAVDHILCLCLLNTRCQTSLLVWKSRLEMLCDLCARSHPNTFFRVDVLNDLLQGSESAWPTDATAMESYSHHLGCSFTPFIVQNVEGSLDVVIKVGWRTETSRDVEFVVVTV